MSDSGRWKMGDVIDHALKDKPLCCNSHMGGWGRTLLGRLWDSKKGWLTLAVGSHLCLNRGAMCRKLCDGWCVLLQEWPGWWTDGRSIQNKNIVLKWGRTSLNLFSSDYYYEEVLICYRETGVGRKETEQFLWVTLVFQTRSPSPSRSGLRAHSGMFYLCRL